MKQFRCFKYETVEQEDEEAVVAKKIVESAKLTNTEKQTIVKARIGQGKFRSDLIEKYDGKCIIIFDVRPFFRVVRVLKLFCNICVIIAEMKNVLKEDDAA